MDFELSDTAKRLRDEVRAFMDERILPAEQLFAEQVAALDDPFDAPPVLEELKAEARRRRLWNLFLPHKTEWTDGLSNLDYAPIAEVLGRCTFASEVLNCSAPDTGNMEILTMFGTKEQKEQWLVPLLNGEIRSAFAMTEPEVASSDATNISCRITREGSDYVINGHKWWISGSGSPRCAILILMGKTNPDSDTYHQQSMILVPKNTPGVSIIRKLPVFGYVDRETHCEIVFDNVRVPVENVLGEEGSGFAIAQSRLGPGRIHHCMRTIGVAERALELLCDRVSSRYAFGSALSEKANIQDWIADARIHIDQARLYTLYTAWLMDTADNRVASTEISAIKVAIPEMAVRIIDHTIQAFGAAGVCDDFGLASMYAHARVMQIVDGPDAVHRRKVARDELKRQAVRREPATAQA